MSFLAFLSGHLDVATRLRLRDQPHTAEHQDDRQRMRGLQDADAHQQRGSHGNNGLHVVVDRDDGRAQRALSDHGQDIAEERSDAHDVGHLPPRLGRYGLGQHLRHMAERERQQHQRCPREHVLVDGEHVVPTDERIEQRQVQREGELGKEAEEVAPDVAHLVAGVSGRGQDEDERSAATHQHARRLLPRDGLLQDNGCQQHGEDGHRRGDDARIDGRRDAQSDGVATLVAHQSEESGTDEHQLVAQRNVLLGRKQRGQPEQQTGTHHAEGDHGDAVEAVRHGILAHRSHQSPSGTGSEHAQMGYQCFVVFHHSIFNYKR